MVVNSSQEGGRRGGRMAASKDLEVAGLELEHYRAGDERKIPGLSASRHRHPQNRFQLVRFLFTVVHGQKICLVLSQCLESKRIAFDTKIGTESASVELSLRPESC
jgi:hypothetical protein